MKRLLAVLLIVFASGAVAQDIPRPPQRLVEEAQPLVAAPDLVRGEVDSRVGVVLRPRPRPGANVQVSVPQTPERDLSALNPRGPRQVARPDARPTAIERAEVERRVARQRGAVCGDVAIQGEAIGRINGPGACGVDGAVRIRSIAGVALQSNPTVDCRTALAMKDWITDGIIPAVGSTGGGVGRLRVVAHYACRDRVGGSSGNRRLSEHALGHAVDIAGIGLKSGREITVLTDWNSRADGAILRRIWQTACGPFGTVLGPEANAAHRDHFHVDTARYRSGAYCR